MSVMETCSGGLNQSKLPLAGLCLLCSTMLGNEVGIRRLYCRIEVMLGLTVSDIQVLVM
jgi:hypothetical protein